MQGPCGGGSMSSPPRGWATLQSRLLAEVRTYDKDARLRRVEEVRVTTLLGSVVERRPARELPAVVEEVSADGRAPTPQELALCKLAALRKAARADSRPCKVADGLYVGGIGAARNLKALRKAGITHVVVPLYDDASADMLAHVEQVNAFIDEGRRHGRVLVHCFAGQSRSAALAIAYLMATQRLGLLDAWAAARRARPCARPNAGFLSQLARYGRALGLEGADADAAAVEGADLSAL
eukprot:scaffold7.g3464.t1